MPPFASILATIVLLCGNSIAAQEGAGRRRKAQEGAGRRRKGGRDDQLFAICSALQNRS
jgi:hypothetical protein